MPVAAWGLIPFFAVNICCFNILLHVEVIVLKGKAIKLQICPCIIERGFGQ